MVKSSHAANQQARPAGARRHPVDFFSRALAPRLPVSAFGFLSRLASQRSPVLPRIYIGDIDDRHDTMIEMIDLIDMGRGTGVRAYS
jgi:hypothetical protein